MRHVLLGLFAVALLVPTLGACKGPSGAGAAPARTAIPRPTADPLDDLVAVLTGSFSSAEQAAADSDYVDIRLHTTPIWPESREGRWLYVEQARADLPDKPYRQRIYHLVAQQDGAIVSEVYELPGDPLAYAGAWKDPAPLARLTPLKITRKDGCGVHLHKTAPGAFVGSTEGSACVSNLRGAAYATSTVRVDAHGLTTWDRGYNADGKQVWGATKGGYQFHRLP